jgi:hypothetical protein
LIGAKVLPPEVLQEVLHGQKAKILKLIDKNNIQKF